MDRADGAGEKPGEPTVLLVEDEPLLRMLGVDTLEGAGFRVVEAATGDEAMAYLDAHDGDAIKVLFTDVNMPGSLDGFTLARRVARRWPEIGVLIVSGNVAPAPGEMPEGGRFVSKPYRPATLVRCIRDMLGEAA